ncbi:hypothetical protein BDP27DRAFT_43950 [Rhodocollybia butyracea]|uniref:Uncharacterized protein n=1 Tax=Rhodocollybia butyracea TaxID=206335 RepID=A0A9P5Q5B7_9AGAR|nr:hypothetical protein BDP27DRAFT_43950 [Rhodocollybia butyracea]
MSELVERTAEIAYADMPLFGYPAPPLSVKFELVWPGYLHYPWLVDLPLFDQDGRRITWTRQELGPWLAFQFQAFAEKCTRKVINSREPAWRIGVGGYKFEHMRLVSFRNITECIWRASVEVYVPYNGWPDNDEEYYLLTGAEGCYEKTGPERRCPSCRVVHPYDPRVDANQTKRR